MSRVPRLLVPPVLLTLCLACDPDGSSKTPGADEPGPPGEDDTASDDEPTDHLRLLEPASAQKPPSAQKERGSVDQEHDHAILSGLEHEHDGGMAKWLRRRIANP